VKGTISGYAWLLVLGGLTFGLIGMRCAQEMDLMDRHYNPNLYSFYQVWEFAGFITAVAGGLLAASDLRRHKLPMRRGETVILGLGLIVLSGFVLFMAWAWFEGLGIGHPESWFTLLAGWAGFVLGIWQFIMGITKKEKKGV